MVYTIIVHLEAKDAEGANTMKAKIVEAAGVYRKDKETLSWYVAEDPKDPLKFVIVERYLNEASQQYHLNKYWPTFDAVVMPLLAKPYFLSRWEEMDVAVPNQDSVAFAQQLPTL